MFARIVRLVFAAPAPTEGQGLVEYGLVVLLISIAVMGALAALSGGIDGLFAAITAALP